MRDVAREQLVEAYAVIPLHAGLTLSEVLKRMECPLCHRNDPRCGERTQLAPGLEVFACAMASDRHPPMFPASWWNAPRREYRGEF